MPTSNLASLIDAVRRQTNTVGTSSTSGIADDEFVGYFNDAQERLQSRISSKYSNIFTKEYEFAPVADQEEYDFPDDAYAVNRVWNLEFSSTGLARDYYNLKKRSFKARTGVTGNYPFEYLLKGNKILVGPIPTSATGMFRLTYEGAVKKLDIARGVIDTFATSGGYYTTITLDSAEDTDDEALAAADYVSFVTTLGTGTTQRGPAVSSYNSTTKVITLASNTFATTDTLVAGMRVVLGDYSTTHTELPDICQRYLKSYVSWKILRRDSNVSDASPQERELEALEKDIEEMFGANDRDEIEIPYTEDCI